MQLKLYSIYDTKSNLYSPPFSSFNDSTALRTMKQSLENNSFASDYVLYYISEFDDEVGLPHTPRLRAIYDSTIDSSFDKEVSNV